MEAQGVDAVAFRDGQRDQWNNAATGWDKWSSLIDEGASGVSDRLVEMADVQAGGRVLDVACGYGEPSLPAARKAGPEGSVVATDIAKTVLEYAAKRAADAGVDDIEFVESEAIALDFPEHSFDAAALALGRDLRAQGRGGPDPDPRLPQAGRKIAVSSWGTPDEVPFLAIPMRTTMKELDVPPPPPGPPGRCRAHTEAMHRHPRGGRLLRRRGRPARRDLRLRVRGGVHPDGARDSAAHHGDDGQPPARGEEAAWQAIENAIGERAGTTER